jgi:hypothetical protein
MWMFTRYGFFSITKPTFGMTKAEADRHLQVRGRVRSHLDALKARFASLADVELIETEDSDYRYRFVVPKETWVEVARQLAEEVDYSNFKSECARKNPWTDSAYVSSLHDIWSVHHALQRRDAKRDQS